MARERVQDLEAQLDAIMSGEYNARNIIDNQSKQIKSLESEKKQIMEKSAESFERITFLEKNKTEIESKLKELEISDEYFREETQQQKEKIKTLEESLFQTKTKLTEMTRNYEKVIQGELAMKDHFAKQQKETEQAKKEARLAETKFAKYKSQNDKEKTALKEEKSRAVSEMEEAIKKNSHA